MNAPDLLIDRIRAIIERVAGPNRSPGEVGPDTRLGDDFWLDSVELLEVIVASEKEFGIVFDEAHDLDGEALATLGGLARVIRSKVSTAGRDL